MNEFFENETLEETEEEFSTVFSDPQQKEYKDSVKGLDRTKKVIFALLAVVILVAGTVGVIKLIPVLQNEPTETESEVTAVNVSTADVKTLSLTNTSGTFNFYPLTEEVTQDGETESQTTWCVEGVDKTLTSSSKIAGIVGDVTYIPAIREITGRTAEDCGLKTPQYTAQFTAKDGDEYSIAVGSQSADKLGNYISVNGKIFLVDTSVTDTFQFELIDLADATSIPGIEITSELSKYVSDDDETRLESFDSITVGGQNFDKNMVINMFEMEEDDITYSNYVLASHGSRVADNTAVATLFSFFTDGVSLTGAYSFENTATSRKAVGLDNPYITVTINLGDVSKTFEISKVDDNNCAIITDDSPMIYKTSHSSIEFLEYATQDFFSKMVYVEYLKDVVELSISSASDSYSFEVAYDADSEEMFNVTYDGKKVTTADFQDFYEDFVGLEYTDFETNKGTSAPEITIVSKLSDGTVDTFKLYKSNSTRYLCELNGSVLGRVSSTQVNQLLKTARSLAESTK